MIQPLQFNSTVNFKGAPSPALQAVLDTQVQQQAENSVVNVEKEKFSISDTYQTVKKRVTNVFKGVNNITGVGAGVARGVVEGGIVAGLIGVIGKNCKNGEGKILATSAGILKDTAKAISVLPKALYNVLWNKSVKENLANVASSALNGIKKLPAGIKKHKLTTAVSIIAGLGIFAFRTVQGKITANNKNADLDHKTNQGHV